MKWTFRISLQEGSQRDASKATWCREDRFPWFWVPWVQCLLLHLGLKWGNLKTPEEGSETPCHFWQVSPPTCLKLPLLLCSQSIISWKIGIMTFRRSGWGIKVTSRKGPIRAGMKWSLCSPKLSKNIWVSVYLVLIKFQKDYYFKFTENSYQKIFNYSYLPR